MLMNWIELIKMDKISQEPAEGVVYRKGQTSVLDFLLAIVFFVILFVFFVNFSSMEIGNSQKKLTYDRLAVSGFSITDLMVNSKGFPSNWDSNISSVQSIGLASESNLFSLSKISAFSLMNYEESKVKLGLDEGNDYYFTISPVSNSSIIYFKSGIEMNTSKIALPFTRYGAIFNDYSKYVGSSDYYIPGPENQTWGVYYDLAPSGNKPTNSSGLRSIISITATLSGTKIYYDHWENRYKLDPNNADATADEIYNLSSGGVKIFESTNVPVSPRGNATYYDGGDRIYVSGGPVEVVRVSWPESTGTIYCLSYELYPLNDLASHYIIPVGEDMYGPPVSSNDFNKVYLMVQAIENSTGVVITDPTRGVVSNVTLNQGNTLTLYHINSSTSVNATKQVNVQFITGNSTKSYVARGYTAVPDKYWSMEYYNPVPGFTHANTTLYIYNPTSSSLLINYEDKNGSGNFSVPAGSTRAYNSLTGRYVPRGSGIYLNSSQKFWAIGAVDEIVSSYEWGYSLVPAQLLTQDYFLGWAPGSSNKPPRENGAAAYVTPTANGTIILVDYSPTDGVVDLNYTLNRLDSVKITDPDNDSTGTHIWTYNTEPFAITWGEDPDTATTTTPYMDLGYTVLPIISEATLPYIRYESMNNSLVKLTLILYGG